VKSVLLVLSSPSGGGKTTIAKRLLAARPDTGYSVSATTRTQRAGEQDGVDYHFLGRSEFEAQVAAGEFLEWATYGGNLYGTLRREVDRVFAQGRHVVMDIEIDGASQLRSRVNHAVHVFILPPSVPVLIARLEGRKTEAAAAVARRLRHAADELAAIDAYDYVVVNDALDHAVAQVSAILDAESVRIDRRPEMLDALPAWRAELLAAAARVEQDLSPQTETQTCGS
jgi:guanylate kinase